MPCVAIYHVDSKLHSHETAKVAKAHPPIAVTVSLPAMIVHFTRGISNFGVNLKALAVACLGRCGAISTTAAQKSSAEMKPGCASDDATVVFVGRTAIAAIKGQKSLTQDVMRVGRAQTGAGHSTEPLERHGCTLITCYDVRGWIRPCSK